MPQGYHYSAPDDLPSDTLSLPSVAALRLGGKKSRGPHNLANFFEGGARFRARDPQRCQRETGMGPIAFPPSPAHLPGTPSP